MSYLRAFLLAVPLLLALAYFGAAPVENPDRHVTSAPDPLTCSAITQVMPEIVRDVTRLPDAITDWSKRLSDFGDVLGILVPFSRAPGSTSLGRPRVLLTVGHPFLNNSPRDPFPSKRDLTQRLFIGVTTAADQSQTLEFISWNQASRRFDFGVIENFDTPAKRRLIVNEAKRGECLACHRTAGPIFPVFPWTGFGVDSLVGVAMMEAAHRREPKQYARLNQALQTWKERAEGSVGRLHFMLTDPKNRTEPDAKQVRTATLFLNGKDTGVRFLENGEADRTAAFDGTVRSGNQDLSLPNQILNALPAAARPLAARLVVIRSLLASYADFPPDILLTFPAYLATQQKELQAKLAGKINGSEELPASRPSQIRDFDPVSGQPNHHPIATSDDHLSYIETIERYNAKREAGESGVPERFRPSGPPAFLIDNVPPSYTLPGAIAAGVPGQILLYQKDLDPLFELLESAAASKQTEVLKAALESPELTSVLQHGVPNRETLLFALHDGLRAELRRRHLSTSGFPDRRLRIPVLSPCDSAGEAPIAPVAENRREGGACVRCHVGADKVGRMHFDFDPEDREAWNSALADPARRDRTRAYLVKVIRRLNDDSMPPEESPERARLNASPRRAEEIRALLTYLRNL